MFNNQGQCAGGALEPILDRFVDEVAFKVFGMTDKLRLLAMYNTAYSTLATTNNTSAITAMFLTVRVRPLKHVTDALIAVILACV